MTNFCVFVDEQFVPQSPHMYLQNKIRGCYKHIEHVAFLCGYRRPQPVSSAKFRPRNGPNHFSLLTSPFLVPAAAAQQPSPHNHRFSQMDTATRYKKDQKPLKTSKKTLGTTTYIINIYQQNGFRFLVAKLHSYSHFIIIFTWDRFAKSNSYAHIVHWVEYILILKIVPVSF